MSNRLIGLVLVVMVLGLWEVRGETNNCQMQGSQEAGRNNTLVPPKENDPIDMTGGAFTQTETDISLPGVLPIEVTRYYMSTADTNGPMGKDWYLGGVTRGLSRDEGAKKFYYSRPDNCRVEMQEGGGSSVTASGLTSSGDYYTLSEMGDTYVVTDKAGNQDTFEKVTPTRKELSESSIVQVGRITEHRDACRNFLTYSYGSDGELIKVEDANHGRYVVFSYNDNHQVSSVSDNTGRTVKYEYNKIKVQSYIGLRNNSIYAPQYDGYFLSKVSYCGTPDHPHGITRQYQYSDKAGLLEAIIDGNGNEVVRNTYQDCGAGAGASNRSDPTNPKFGMVASQKYLGYKSGLLVGNITDPNNERTIIFVNAKGQQKSYYSDGWGNILEERVGSFLTSTEYYKKSHNVAWKKQETLPDQSKIQYSYDDYGNVLSITKIAAPGSKVNEGEGTQATQVSKQFTYDTTWFHQVTSIMDENGNVTRYEYGDRNSNPSGKVLKIIHSMTYSGQAVEEFTYNRDGQVDTHKQGDGTVTKYLYDGSSGYLKEKIEDYNGKKASTKYSYDQWGHISSVTDPNGNVTQSTFDPLGNLIQVVAATGEQEQRHYDGEGNLTSSVKLGGGSGDQKVENIYNQYAQLMEVRIYRSASSYLATKYEYDGNGDKTGVIDPLGRRTTMDYDERRQVKQVVDPLGNVVKYEYDANGNRNQLTDELGRVTQFGYDGLGRLQRKTYADGSYQTWAYDKVGNPIRMQTTGGKIQSVSYDPMNRKQNESRDGTTLFYSYDLMGRLASAAENGQAIRYEYDSLGRVTKFTDQAKRSSSYEYDLNGNRTKATYPSGAIVKRSFDGSNRLKTVKDQLDRTVASYSYDKLGRLQVVNLGNNTSSSYSYDLLNRTVGINNSFAGNQVRNYSYGYNDAGMRVFVDGPRGHVSYQYNNRDELTGTLEPNGSPFATQSWDYDAAYNRKNWTQGTQQTIYQVNNLNQYTGVSNYVAPVWDQDGNLKSFNNQSNSYDTLGRMVSTVTASNKILYSYDPLGRRTKKVVQDLNGKTLQTYEYHPDGDEVAVEYRPDNTWTYYIGPVLDRQIARVNANGQTQYYYHEAFNVSALANSSGNIIEKYEYNPQGQVQITDANNQTKPTTQIGNDFLFAGRNLDFETGNYYVRARYYNPMLGRFISRDPLDGAEFSQGTNLYAYCRNNFVNLTDPSGEAWPAVVAAGVIGAAVIVVAIVEYQVNYGRAYAETLSGTPLTITGKNYDSLSDIGKYVIDVHEDVHKNQSYWENMKNVFTFNGDENEIPAYQKQFDLTTELLKNKELYPSGSKERDDLLTLQMGAKAFFYEMQEKEKKRKNTCK